MSDSQKNFWKRAVLAGLISGSIYMLLQIVMFPLVGQDPLTLPFLIAAIVLGPDILSATIPSLFNVMASALAIHFLLSLLYAAITGVIIRNMPLATSVLTGGLIGLLVYLINYHFIAAIVFEWFAIARHWVCTTNHIFFGIITAWAFKTLPQGQRARLST